MSRQYNAIVTQEDSLFVALNPETGIASQGKDINESLANLQEALSLYLEEARDVKTEMNHSFLTTITV